MWTVIYNIVKLFYTLKKINLKSPKFIALVLIPMFETTTKREDFVQWDNDKADAPKMY